MKRYIHNPNIYRQHYQNQVGRALPAFKGTRIQHGYGLGSFLGKLARKALPLLASGAKLVAPHLKKAFKGIAKDVTGKVAQEATTRLVGAISEKGNKPKKARKVISKSRKVKASTSKDIFF